LIDIKKIIGESRASQPYFLAKLQKYFQKFVASKADCDDFFYHFSDFFIQKLPLSH
jgi:aminopeptidase N